MMHAAACLLTFIGYAHLDLTKAYEKEMRQLITENGKIVRATQSQASA